MMRRAAERTGEPRAASESNHAKLWGFSKVCTYQNWEGCKCSTKEDDDEVCVFQKGTGEVSMSLLCRRGFWEATNKSMKAVDLIGARSLISQAAGSPVVRVINPMIRNVQAGPRRDINPSMAKLMTVPPSPPLAYTMPLARPRLLLKYWAGVTETT